MTLREETAALELLRRAFPPKLIGKIPASQGRPALDYVGHAAVTDRLIAADPDYTYTVDHEFSQGGSFWIRGTLTVHGVSRVEYGEGKNPLEAVSHFLRRAAMRFGVALDLWSKEELAEAWTSASSSPSQPESTHPASTGPSGRDGGAERGEGVEEPAGNGEGPTGSTPNPPSGEPDLNDLSFHPSKPHRWAIEPDFPGYEVCTTRPCPAWRYVGARKVEEVKGP